ncbi:MAG: Trm112 family protein [Candidatus Omnitrophota bacterium]
MINEELLSILACPFCKGDVKLEGEKIVCVSCGRKYPIKEGIPVMLVEEAEVPKEDKNA